MFKVSISNLNGNLENKILEKHKCKDRGFAEIASFAVIVKISMAVDRRPLYLRVCLLSATTVITETCSDNEITSLLRGQNEALASQISTLVYVFRNGGTHNSIPIFLFADTALTAKAFFPLFGADLPPTPALTVRSFSFFDHSISSFKIATCDHSNTQPRNRNSKASKKGGGSESDRFLFPNLCQPPALSTKKQFLSPSSLSGEEHLSAWKRPRVTRLRRGLLSGWGPLCYLMRPSARGAPRWDLGSGLRELHGFFRQACMTGQAVGPTAQISAASHSSPTRPSTQRSSCWPVRAAFLLDCST